MTNTQRALTNIINSVDQLITIVDFLEKRINLLEKTVYAKSSEKSEFYQDCLDGKVRTIHGKISTLSYE